MQALRSKNGTTADLVDEMFETFLDWRAPARVLKVELSPVKPIAPKKIAVKQA